MRLSDRLECILSLVPKGYDCADIGCDHGFLSIELIKRKISGHVYAMDVRPGPLGKAAENVKNAGLESEIDLILSNGFEKLSAGKAGTAVIAGMGGCLIRDILMNGPDLVKVMDSLVVQPQSNIPEFRRFLRQNGFEIIRNEVVFDMGKYYFPMRIKYTGAVDESDEITASDRYGADLVKENRGLSEYLEHEYASYEAIKKKLSEEDGDHEDRLLEIAQLMELNRQVYSQIKKD